MVTPLNFGSVSGVSFTGIASGLDTASIVNALVAVEANATKQPLLTKKSTLQSKLDALGNFETKLKNLLSKVQDLDSVSEFLAYKVSSSNTNVFTATATGSAAEAAHTITVTKLAQAETETHANGFSNSDVQTVGTGTLHINYGGSNYDLTVDSSNNTLATLASSINADTTLSSKVTASVVNTGTPSVPAYKLILTGKDTDETKTISIDASGVTGGDQALGATSQISPAQNAELTVDGLTISRTTNSITDVIPGVTINLVGAGGPSQLTVAKDVDSIKSKINSFVSAYNELASFMKTQQKFTEGETTNPLFADFGVSVVRSTLPSILTSIQNEANPSLGSLASIGISIQSDGTLKVDDTKLSDALSDDPTAVATLFVTGVDANGGAAEQIKDFLEGFINGTTAEDGSALKGLLKTEQDTATDTIAAIDKQLVVVDQRLKSFTEQLNKKFSNLETVIGQLQSQQTFLTQFKF